MKTTKAVLLILSIVLCGALFYFGALLKFGVSASPPYITPNPDAVYTYIGNPTRLAASPTAIYLLNDNKVDIYEKNQSGFEKTTDTNIEDYFPSQITPPIPGLKNLATFIEVNETTTICLANTDADSRYYIFNCNSQTSVVSKYYTEEFFINPTSLVKVATNVYAFIDDSNIFVINLISTDSYNIASLSAEPEKNYGFNNSKSYEPISLAMQGNNLLVLDSFKNSVSEYSVSGVSLTYIGSPLAYRGADDYFYNLAAVCSLEDGRFVVADDAGLRLFKNGTAPELLSSDIKQVKIMKFDYFNNLYIYSSDGFQNKALYKFDLTTETATPLNTTEEIFDIATSHTAKPFFLKPSGIYDSNGTNLTSSVPFPILTSAARISIAADNKTIFLSTGTSANYIIELGETTTITASPIDDQITAQARTSDNKLLFIVDNTLYLSTDEALSNANNLNIEVPENFSYFSFDRLDSNAYFVAANDAVIKLPITHANLNKVPSNPPDDWTETTALEVKGGVLPQLFVKTTAETALYAYPNAIKVKTTLPSNKTLKFLNLKEDEDWSLVMYEVVGENAVVGYINNEFIAPENSDLVIKTPNFLEQNTLLRARIIVDGIKLYKYPTSIGTKNESGEIVPVTLGSPLKKTISSNATTYVYVSRLIESLDANNWKFYEIWLNDDLKPAETGTKVAYIPERFVIDADEPSEKSKFVANAKVKCAEGDIVKVYSNATGTEEYSTEILINAQEIRVSEAEFDKKSAFTKVYYYDYSDAENPYMYSGYIETKFVKVNGWGALQWVGLGLTITAAGAVLAASLSKISKRMAKKAITE
ncbi:MAG: hypothetical protein LBM01_02160 [Christensenellaceae bacterium]|jgi:hypothetical protein|nr:hypothetical protein [Christensenellaceae bacterium]